MVFHNENILVQLLGIWIFKVILLKWIMEMWKELLALINDNNMHRRTPNTYWSRNANEWGDEHMWELGWGSFLLVKHLCEPFTFFQVLKLLNMMFCFSWIILWDLYMLNTNYIIFTFVKFFRKQFLNVKNLKNSIKVVRFKPTISSTK